MKTIQLTKKQIQMKPQQGLFLTKTVEGATFTFANISGNYYRLECSEGELTIGKGALLGDRPINQPSTHASGKSMEITKAEMKRLGTYKAYWNGIDLQEILYSDWTDRNGNKLFFKDGGDFYYYFRRFDCGLILRETSTVFHRPESEGVKK